eukprot:TRINITY_DN5943_c0_g1_i1.p1 TRINITY_DN5943_c0_g1~~TRINITY_DN5943_c0_g1_i1.p1  ORF type:complete len:147 (+),score=15.85 TRINITY_DN5943_c0_g1_i1:29-442(+)
MAASPRAEVTVDWKQLEDASKQTPERPACWDAFKVWKYCTTPAHQMKNYYVHGDVDPCKWEWEDLKLCLSLKMTPPAEAAARWEKRLQEKLERGEGHQSISTIGVIWEARQPSDQPQDGQIHDDSKVPPGLVANDVS